MLRSRWLDRDACFDLLGPYVRSSRSRGLYGIRASSVCGIVRCLRSFFLPVWTTVFELRVLALCAFVGFWELVLRPCLDLSYLFLLWFVASTVCCFVGLWNRSGVFVPSPSQSGLRSHVLDLCLLHLLWTTVFELRVLASCAFVGFWELGLLPLSSVVPSDSSRSSPSFLLGIFYGMVLRRSWVGSVGWLRSWVVGVLEGLLRYAAS